MNRLSESEEAALMILKNRQSLPIWTVPDKNEKTTLGSINPGIAAYKKLEKRGLCVICDPLIDDNGDELTASVEITCEGREWPL